jgi:hypothetical protein
MTTTPPGPPRDDEARFQQWIADVGPAQQHPDDLPDVDVGKPLAAAVAVLTGLAAIVAGLGWLSLWLAINIGAAIDTTVLVLLGVGTVLIILGGAVAYEGYRRRFR